MTRNESINFEITLDDFIEYKILWIIDFVSIIMQKGIYNLVLN